ncbi:protein transport protein S31, partial [Coemansia biformis]
MGYQYIERTAVPAWGPQQTGTLLAAGTVAGAMDASFSNTSSLEIFRLNADGVGPAAAAGKAEASARFQRLSWQTRGLDGTALGVLAGGLENGDVAFWDPQKILEGESDAQLHSSSAHTGAVSGLEFNPQQPNLVATGATNGEVFIWDIVNEFKSHSAGARSQKLDSVTDLSWNNQVQHILVTASNTGALVVWDLRQHREIMALNSPGAIGNNVAGRAGASAVVWNPASATQLVSASGDDNSPEIMFWDLRNANAPARTLAGHQRGILSLSWCRKDAGLLLSSGKDNRTVCWDPIVAEIVGELPPSTNWVYDVQWNQANPNLLSGASFDGRISLYTLARESDSSTAGRAAAATDDPFAPQSTSAFAPSLSLKRPPKWLARPCGAVFGFGGQLVHFGQQQQAGSQALVSIEDFVSEPALAQQAQQLEELLQNDRASELCGERLEQSKGTDQERSWHVLQILFASNARDQLINFLGFDKEAVQQRIRELLAAKQQQQVAPNPTDKIDSAPTADASKEDEEGDDTGEPKPEDDNLFAGSTSADADAEDFFSHPPPSAQEAAAGAAAAVSAPVLSSAADADVRALQVAFSGAFNIYDKAKDVASEDADGLVTRAVLLGDIESAVELCIEQERFADALVLATCGSAELATRAQQAYFARRAQQASYVRLLHGIVTGDLSDVVGNADISEWDECLALLCTYAQGDQFSVLCEVLGRRLEAAKQLSNAVMCYLASGNLDKVAAIWIADEKSRDDGHGRVQRVHSLVEKVSVFRKAVQFIDPATTEEQPVFPLAPLYDVYIEYAQFLVSQGLRDIADKYLQRVPATYRIFIPTGEDALATLRNRLDAASMVPWTFKPVSADGFQQQQQQQTAPQKQQQQQAIPHQLVQQQPVQQPYNAGYPAANSGYGGAVAGFPPTSMPPVQHYTASGMPAYPAPATSAAYPSGAYPATTGAYAGMAQGYPVQAPSTGVFPPPPQPLNPASIPTGLSPPPRREEGAWNDPPMLASKLAKRPPPPASKPAAIVSPFPQGRDTPPPASMAPFAANVRSPLQSQPAGSFPPPPPAAANMAFPAAQHAPHQPMAQPFQPPAPGMMPPQFQQPPPQQQQQQPARGQVVTAASAAAPARTATPAGRQADSPANPSPKYPPGDRSHLPAEWKPIAGALTTQLVQAQKFAAPGQKRMVDDASRRLNQLFDLMNCDEIKGKDKLVPVFTQLVQALTQRQYPAALQAQAELMTINSDITTNMVGVKHLINVLKTLP